MPNEIVIQGRTVIELIISIADWMKVSPIINNKECLLEIPKSFGSGFIKASEYSLGLSVVEVNGFFNEDLNVKVINYKAKPLKLIFNKQSEFIYSSKNSAQLTKVNKYDSVISALGSNAEYIFSLPNASSISIFIIEIDGKIFEKKIESLDIFDDERTASFLEQLKKDATIYDVSTFSLTIGELIKHYQYCNYSGFLRYIYREAKINEILTERFKQYLDDQIAESDKLILRKSTVNSINKAADIIAKELSNLDVIPTIAKRVQLSANKLQKGFLKLYGLSVNRYIADVRLKRAIDLLEKSNLNITEITYEIGISSKSYFSKIFKDKFGMTPQEYRQSFKSRMTSL